MAKINADEYLLCIEWDRAGKDNKNATNYLSQIKWIMKTGSTYHTSRQNSGCWIAIISTDLFVNYAPYTQIF